MNGRLPFPRKIINVSGCKNLSTNKCMCMHARLCVWVCVSVCVCQNDNLHWVNTPTLDSYFGLVGQEGAECD